MSDEDYASLCEIPGHVGGFWEDDQVGIWYCPTCNIEIWIGDEE